MPWTTEKIFLGESVPNLGPSSLRQSRKYNDIPFDIRFVDSYMVLYFAFIWHDVTMDVVALNII